MIRFKEVLTPQAAFWSCVAKHVQNYLENTYRSDSIYEQCKMVHLTLLRSGGVRQDDFQRSPLIYIIPCFK